MSLSLHFYKRKVRPDKAAAPPSSMQAAAQHLEGIAEDDDRLPSSPGEWLFLMFAAAVVGALVGVIGAAYRVSLDDFADARIEIIAWAHHHGFWWLSWLIPTILCAAGAALACYLTQKFSPQTAGSGIPHVEAALRHHLRPVEMWMVPVKFIAGSLGIGSGLALGREGPTVHMGATIGRHASDALKGFLREPWTLIAAGAGAGLAVTFNAPLAAIVFVMEELLHRFSARIFSAALVACISGTIVLRLMLGNITDFSVPHLTELRSTLLPNYLLLGLFAGVLGVGYNIALIACIRLSSLASNWPRGAKGAMVGAVVGLLAWYSPNLVGGGESLAQSAIVDRIPFALICGILLVRFVLTITSYSTGAAGGLFAPLLALGALLGSAFASGESSILHRAIDPAPYAIVGMAACFTAVVRSPLTGVILLLEMTGSWPLILPMLAASLTAYSIPELLGNAPIYDTLRQRDESMELAAAGEPKHL